MLFYDNYYLELEFLIIKCDSIKLSFKAMFLKIAEGINVINYKKKTFRLPNPEKINQKILQFNLYHFHQIFS